MIRPQNCILAAGLALCLALPLAAQTVDDARAAYRADDFARAVEIARPLADAGNPDAINLMATMFEDGVGGLPRDEAQALALYTQAAELGSAAGLNNLGRIYHHGSLGQAVDAPRAEQLYLRAIEGGSQFGQNNYALLLESGLLGPPDWARIVQLYESAADRDEPNAAANLANLYLNGREGLPVDDMLARQWAERAVLLNNARGMRLLGYMLEFGLGGPEDVPRAIAMYQRSFDLGDGAAANDLGLLYAYGATGVPANRVTAATWFERGIALQDTWSHVNMADLLVDGEPDVPDNGVRARALFGFAHEAGNLDASVQLSYLHWDGVGGPVDYDTARSLLTYASEEGDIGAMNDLGVMLQQGLGGPVDIFGAAHLYQRAAERGHTLGAQNLAYILIDTTKAPADPVEGLAWCHFSSEREESRETQLEYRQNCSDIAQDLPEADRRAAIARSIELLAQF